MFKIFDRNGRPDNGCYWYSRDGVLYNETGKVNTTDRRRRDYRRVEWWTGKTDSRGDRLYSGDRIKYLGLTGQIVWRPDKAAFIFEISDGAIRTPYAYLNGYGKKIEKLGD